MAATRPKLPALDTPLSASFPSEMKSPFPGTSAFLKQEEGQRTPITPPAAYLDFLSKLSPSAGMMTPVSATGPGPKHFTFSEKSALVSQASTDSAASSSSSLSVGSNVAPEKSQPTSPTSSSSRSSSCSSELSTKTDGNAISITKTEMKPPPLTSAVGKVIPPPSSPFGRPGCARSPRRLHIPLSPFSPASVRSPLSASSSVYSPYSATWSPRDPSDPERKTIMNVRQVTTRTVVHYSRTTPQMEPVPPSKKRKMEGEMEGEGKAAGAEIDGESLEKEEEVEGEGTS